MKQVMSDSAVQIGLGAVVPLVLATMFAPSLIGLVMVLWVVWAIIMTASIVRAVKAIES